MLCEKNREQESDVVAVKGKQGNMNKRTNNIGFSIPEIHDTLS